MAETTQETTQGFKCGECGKAFGGEHGLNVHVARMHGPAAVGRKAQPRKPRPSKPAAAGVTDTTMFGAMMDVTTELLGQATAVLSEMRQRIPKLREANLALREALIRSRVEVLELTKMLETGQ